MDFKILFASFALVFLAELGDKTQLTALAFSSRFNSPWSVFIGTSLALIATTALAVALGGLLNRVLPPKILQISSAVMFILIGLFLLVNIARRAPMESDNGKTTPPQTGEQGAAAMQPRGMIFALVIKQATTFEQNVVDYLESLTARLQPGHARETLEQIIDEDKKHLAAIDVLRTSQHQLAAEHPEPVTQSELRELEKRAPKLDDFNLDTSETVKATIDESDREIVDRAIAAEEGIADFYLTLARMAKIHAVRDAFRALAMDDIRHAQTLCSLINPTEAT